MLRRHSLEMPEITYGQSLVDTQYALAHQRCIEEMNDLLTLVTDKEDYRHRPLYVSKKLRRFLAAVKSINREPLDTLRGLLRVARPTGAAEVERALDKMIAHSDLILDDMHARTSRDAVSAFNDPYKDCPCPSCARILGVTASVCCCGGCCCQCCITHCCPSARALTCAIL